MARYFFDITDGEGFHPDDFGDEFASLAEARDQAQVDPARYRPRRSCRTATFARHHMRRAGPHGTHGLSGQANV